MKDEHEHSHMDKLKMKQEMLNAMDEKELRAFITGYMLGQKKVFKFLKSHSGCACGGSGGCGGGCGGGEAGGCKGKSGCGREDCNCKKEQ